jgi:uncharacterized protein (TIGR00255 family)
MTGFARARRSGEAGEVIVTLKSVNHRALDLHIHAGAEFDPFEPAVRNLVKSRVSRGHVDVRIAFNPAPGIRSSALNRPMFEAYLAAVREAASYGLAAEPDVQSALRIAGMLAPTTEEDVPAGLEALLMESAREALDALNAFRAREGSAIVAELQQLNAVIRRDAAAIAELRAPVVDFLRRRLEERLRELLNGVALEPQRLAQEVAVLADRGDITEEVSRLQLHTAELDALLEKGGELGKKLDFLLQEMNRETNTILSKTSGAGEAALNITSLALEIKANVERIREQGLNLE